MELRYTTGDMLEFAGTVSGDGAVTGTVLGEKTLQFAVFSGTFDGTVSNFDSLQLRNGSTVEFSHSVEAGSLYYELSDGSTYESDAFVTTFNASFSFSGNEENVSIELGHADTSTAWSYNLIYADDLSVFDDSDFYISDYNGEIASMTIGETVDYGKGSLSLVENNGIQLIYTLA